MIARINARKRSAYSAGGTGLILCYTAQRQNPRAQTTRKKKAENTYPVCRHALPQMLDPLHHSVRRQYIDDTEVIHRMERLVLLVRRADPALILVKEKVLPVARVHLGQDSITDALQIRVRVLMHRATHDVRLLHCGSPGPPPVQVPLCVRLRGDVDVGRREDSEGVAPDVVAVSASHVVDPDEE